MGWESPTRGQGNTSKWCVTSQIGIWTEHSVDLHPLALLRQKKKGEKTAARFTALTLKTLGVLIQKDHYLSL